MTLVTETHPSQPAAATPTTRQPSPAQLLADLRAERARFRDDLRREILAQHEQPNGWCFNGTNQVLQDLGLGTLQYDYTGQVTITLNVTVHGANGEHQAESWVRGALNVTSNDDDVTIDDIAVNATDSLYRDDAH